MSGVSQKLGVWPAPTYLGRRGEIEPLKSTVDIGESENTIAWSLGQFARKTLVDDDA